MSDMAGCMEFDLGQTDALLSTTRAVRRRLDLDREVPDKVLLDCIDLAEQAPAGANYASSRRWLIIRDPETRAKLAQLYREGAGDSISRMARRFRGAGHPNQRMWDSTAYLSANLERVPALVIATVLGIPENTGRPRLFDSVIQAAWSFCLALRSRGLGSTWTTAHLGRAKEVADLLGIPDGVTQVVLLPVAWTKGTDFKPVPRRPALEITWFDKWGNTRDKADTSTMLSTEPGVTVEIDIDALPERVWEFVSDINIPARFGNEFKGAEWVDADGPRLGASFIGRNHNDNWGGAWQTTSYIVAYDPPKVFGWNVGNPDFPSAQWRFELEYIGAGTRLRQHMTFGPDRSGTSYAMEQDPADAARILAGRREEVRENMESNIRGIKRLAEEGN